MVSRRTFGHKMRISELFRTIRRAMNGSKYKHTRTHTTTTVSFWSTNALGGFFISPKPNYSLHVNMFQLFVSSTSHRVILKKKSVKTPENVCSPSRKTVCFCEIISGPNFRKEAHGFR